MFVKRTKTWATVYTLLWLLSTYAHAFSAYSNDELDQLERTFIQEINLSDSVVRDPLANDYIVSQWISYHAI